MVVSLGSPTTLNCYVLGYPYPAVTWFKDKKLIPLRTSDYEVRKDYSLHINSVQLSNLGIYTCQAYNGYGKAASWSVTVQALGPIHSTNPEDDQYLPYLINQPEPHRQPENPNQFAPPPQTHPEQTPQINDTIQEPSDYNGNACCFLLIIACCILYYYY